MIISLLLQQQQVMEIVKNIEEAKADAKAYIKDWNKLNVLLSSQGVPLPESMELAILKEFVCNLKGRLTVLVPDMKFEDFEYSENRTLNTVASVDAGMKMLFHMIWESQRSRP